MKSPLVIAIATLGILLARESTSLAYQLEPISRVFAPTGSQATQSFEVVNTGSDRVAVMISFVTLERDESYAESNRDADDDFLAYPSQIVLAPGKRQTVRVTWLGTPNPARELTYRIIVTQVPISTLDRTAAPDGARVGQVSVLVNYRGTMFIRPPNAAPRVAVDTAVLATDKERGTVLALTLANSGNALGVIKSCSVRVAPAAGGPEVTLAATALAPLHKTRVLARSKRRYLVAWPPTLAIGPVKVNGRCTVEP